jgi:hypothetical protein
MRTLPLIPAGDHIGVENDPDNSLVQPVNPWRCPVVLVRAGQVQVEPGWPEPRLPPGNFAADEEPMRISPWCGAPVRPVGELWPARLLSLVV